MYMAKAWVAFFGAILTALTAALSDDVLGASDAQQVALTVIPALATLWAAYNAPYAPSRKGDE